MMSDSSLDSETATPDREWKDRLHEREERRGDLSRNCGTRDEG